MGEEKRMLKDAEGGTEKKKKKKKQLIEEILSLCSWQYTGGHEDYGIHE